MSGLDENGLTAVSPASSGGAGARIESQVGAGYMLAMLAGAAVRGLPGYFAERLEWQRGGDGRPLDDLVVHACDPQGRPAILEVQVKRSITFAPRDPVFEKVVRQIALAAKRDDFWKSRYELAIATTQISRKIAGPYQDLLTWARQLGNADIFFARLARAGQANDDMRSFVSTFRTHLASAGHPSDDDIVWRLLQRLQIHVYDVTAEGSLAVELAVERAARVLDPAETHRAVALWSSLVELAGEISASGGDRTRDRLLTDLVGRHFRLAGHPDTRSALAALAEASAAALARIDDRIDGFTLQRPARLDAIRAAREQGGYLELRGDAGVGKSALLRHFAGQASLEGPVIVLRPAETIGGGWLQMRAVLGYPGTADQLMADMVAGGGGTLFIDNLDVFEGAARLTVVDLIRAAGRTPGASVIASARRNFGRDEPSWLTDALIDQLGRANPVDIEELSAAEVEELRAGVPRLAALLSDSHPARAVARNLFRLRRLAAMTDGGSTVRTEVDMAVNWWTTADGLPAGRRERARVLRDGAAAVLDQGSSFDASSHPSAAIDELLASESMFDVGADRLTFRHDVLREWALANLLIENPGMVERLCLSRPASPIEARALELASRYRLERNEGPDAWLSLIQRLDQPGVHRTWSRSALLAIVRSEVAEDLLIRTEDALLADGATLGRRLLALVAAVETQPASQLIGKLIDLPKDALNIPLAAGPAWYRLVRWSLNASPQLPHIMLPELAKLYTSWLMTTLGLTPLTRELLTQAKNWLMLIGAFNREGLDSTLPAASVREVREELRILLYQFAEFAPEAAADYVTALDEKGRREDAVRDLLIFRGSLAKVAPRELASIFGNALIPAPRKEDHRTISTRDRDRAFEWVDTQFLPESPAQGPFFELLTYAPAEGLALIRRLVAHAVGFCAKGEPGDDRYIVPATGDAPERQFAWTGTYYWCRSGRDHSVTSALMALEAWAHQRVEAGVPIEDVIDDIIGPVPAPAAYLLIVVDLLISHWPTSRRAAVPFLGCPELLVVDRERQVLDQRPDIDIFGLKAMQREPAGAVQLSSLKARLSRQVPLDALVPHYASHGDGEGSTELRELLDQAIARLGAPAANANLGDAAFMAQHMRNLADPGRYKDMPLSETGGRTGYRQYVPPPVEAAHFAEIGEGQEERARDLEMVMLLGEIIEGKAGLPMGFAAAAATWAQQAETTLDARDAEFQSVVQEAITTAAFVAILTPAVSPELLDWASDAVNRALARKGTDGAAMREGLRYNPRAVAFAARLGALAPGAVAPARAILSVVGEGDLSIVEGFRAGAPKLAATEPRLLRAILRVALATCRRPWKDWSSEEADEAKQAAWRATVAAGIDAEIAWLDGAANEPGWPRLSAPAPRGRRRLRLPGAVPSAPPVSPGPALPTEEFNGQAAARWLKVAAPSLDEAAIVAIVQGCAAWSAAANGAGLEASDQSADRHMEWNAAFYDLVIRSADGLGDEALDDLLASGVCALPDENFYDVLGSLLLALDRRYFNDQAITGETAAAIRRQLGERLKTSRGWARLVGSAEDRVELSLATGVSAMFFAEHHIGQGAPCYLKPVAIDRIDPFMPVVAELAAAGASAYVTTLFMGLLEIAPAARHLGDLIATATAWMAVFRDDRIFWIDRRVAARIVSWIEKIDALDAAALACSQPYRAALEDLLAAMVAMGSAEARRLEASLLRR